MVDISIIVCTLNRAASLERTLAGLEEVLRDDSLNAQALVIDNGSSDQTRSVVFDAAKRCPGISYLEHLPPGQAGARNAGLRAAKGKFIVFTDDDVIPAAGWLPALIAPLQSGKYDAVAGSVTIAPHLVKPWMSPMHLSWIASTAEIDMSSPTRMVGANMAFHRRVLDRIPGFDEELGPGALGFCDDSLFSKQLLEAGFRIAGVENAIVEHHCDISRTSKSAYLQSAAKMGRSDAYLTYHWEHSTGGLISGGRLNCKIRVMGERLRSFGPLPSESEMYWHYAYAYNDFLASQRGLQRKYSRRGLKKLSNDFSGR